MFLVVEEKGQILGYCGLLTVLDEGDVTNVAVRKDRQREGIGNFLMESMVRLACERGITMIHLEVRAGNETAIRLYERQGFVKDGTAQSLLYRPHGGRCPYDTYRWEVMTGKEEKNVRCLFAWLRWNDAAAA